MAADAATSFQIADRLGIANETVRRIAKESGINIPADKFALGKRRPVFDINIVLTNIIADLDAMEDRIRQVGAQAASIERSTVAGRCSELRKHSDRLRRLADGLRRAHPGWGNDDTED